jgi:hypothetical protein
MGEGSSGPDPGLPGGAGDAEATQTFQGRDPAARAGQAAPADPPGEAAPSHPPTQAVPPSDEAAPSHPPTQAVPPLDETPPPPAEAVPPQLPSQVVRYGPGVPVTVSAGQAELLWRTGRLPAPPRRRRKLRRFLGSAITVILLAASGVVLFLRFYHAPFHVTGVVIWSQTPTSCGVDVTGRISTNGAAGTVSYQWQYQTGQQAPQPLNQLAVAGQHALYVTDAIEGSGHGSASQTVTLQVLGPDPRSASAQVTVTC